MALTNAPKQPRHRERVRQELERLRNQYAEVIAALRDSLGATTKEQFDKAKLAEHQRLAAEFAYEVRREARKLFDAELATERERVEKMEQEMRQHVADWKAKSTKIDYMMTQEEFKLIRSCLHPDKQPEELRKRFGKAFEVFNRLEKTVNAKAPIAELRARGWEKVSSRYKG